MGNIVLYIWLAFNPCNPPVDPFEYIPDIHAWPAPVTRSETDIRNDWITGPRGGVYHFVHGHKVYRRKTKISSVQP